MQLNKIEIPGVRIIEFPIIQDQRGVFTRLFCQETLSKDLGTKNISQINYTFTKKRGVVRGLHYQIPPYSEIKIVRCLKGSIFDVVLDLRKDSKTFLQWYGINLSEKNKRSLLIPMGCAHGFQTLQKNCELIYLHTQSYSKKNERAVRFDDPLINIEWPLEISETSERDANHTFLTKKFKGITP